MMKGVEMDWMKCVVIGAQCVVFAGLVVLVALGKDSSVTDALLAVSGSLVGTGVFQAVKGKSVTKSD